MGKIEELEELQKLKIKGSITEKEFEVEKRRILNGNDSIKSKNIESTVVENKIDGIYIACLVLGFLSFLFGEIKVVGLILCITALVVCVIASKKLKRGDNNGERYVTVGIIFSIISGIEVVIFTVLPLITMIIENIGVNL